MSKINKAESFIDKNSFQTIIQQTPISTQIFTPDGLTVSVNKAWEKLWQIDPKFIINKYNILKDQQLVKSGLMTYIKKGFKGEISQIPAIKYEPEKTLPNVSNVPMFG